jgi:hypothetical protein
MERVRSLPGVKGVALAIECSSRDDWSIGQIRIGDQEEMTVWINISS